MSLRHPGKVALQQWLAEGDDVDVDRHVGTCQRCAAILEELDASGEAPIGEALAEALDSALADHVQGTDQSDDVTVVLLQRLID